MSKDKNNSTTDGLGNNESGVNIEVPTNYDIDMMVKRAIWSSKVELLLSLIGSAVGLGNIWRFPYLCFRNGGGAFLIPYIISLVLIGVPMLFFELSLGQFSSRNAFTVWYMAPLIKGIGISSLLINFVIASYYSVVISWAVHFFFSSFTATLPWSTCNNWWNTDNCCAGSIEGGLNYSLIENCASPSEEYFFNRVLQVSENIQYQGTLVWELVGCLAFIWVVVFLVIIKGVASIGKVVYFTTIFPYILLTAMLVRGVTLEGAKDGLYYYLYPDFSALANAKTWSDAATQIFFSLSLSHGSMLSMASFNKFKNNIVRDTLIVSVINGLTSFYGGFAIFSVLGYMSKSKGVPIEEVVDKGPGLAFIAYPEGLRLMPISPLWSVFFFLMMVILGLSSMFSLTEVINIAFLDGIAFFRRSRLRNVLFRACVCLFIFLADFVYLTNAGYYVLSTVDSYLSGAPMLVCAFIEMTTVAFLYGYTRYAEDVEMMLGKKLNIFFRITINFITPALLMAVLIASVIQFETPVIRGKVLGWEGALAGWLMVAVILIFLPLWFICYYMKNGGWKLMKELNKPSKDWGPAMQENRVGVYKLDCNESSGNDNNAFKNDDPSNEDDTQNTNFKYVPFKDHEINFSHKF